MHSYCFLTVKCDLHVQSLQFFFKFVSSPHIQTLLTLRKLDLLPHYLDLTPLATKKNLTINYLSQYLRTLTNFNQTKSQKFATTYLDGFISSQGAIIQPLFPIQTLYLIAINLPIISQLNKHSNRLLLILRSLWFNLKPQHVTKDYIVGLGQMPLHQTPRVKRIETLFKRSVTTKPLASSSAALIQVAFSTGCAFHFTRYSKQSFYLVLFATLVSKISFVMKNEWKITLTN